jgi:hypothetical protein
MNHLCGERERQRRAREEATAAILVAVLTALVIGLLFHLADGGHVGGHR